MIPGFDTDNGASQTRYYAHPDGRVITRTVHGNAGQEEPVILLVPEGCAEIEEGEALSRIEALRAAHRAEVERVRAEALANIDADYRALRALGFPDRVARRLAAGTASGVAAGLAEDIAGGAVVGQVLNGGGDG